MVAIAGAKHKVFSEGVVAFVQLKKGRQGAPVDEDSVCKKIVGHCKDISGSKRPNLIVFLVEIPMNRIDKTDYKQLYDVVE